MDRTVRLWLLIGAAGFCLLPWYTIEDGFCVDIYQLITDDVEAARTQANIDLALYGQLPSYRRMLDREGAANPGDLVLIGDADTVREGLEQYKSAGTSEVALNFLGDKEAAWEAVAPLGSEI